MISWSRDGEGHLSLPPKAAMPVQHRRRLRSRRGFQDTGPVEIRHVKLHIDLARCGLHGLLDPSPLRCIDGSVCPPDGPAVQQLPRSPATEMSRGSSTESADASPPRARECRRRLAKVVDARQAVGPAIMLWDRTEGRARVFRGEAIDVICAEVATKIAEEMEAFRGKLVRLLAWTKESGRSPA
jgi:hypothetical protein